MQNNSWGKRSYVRTLASDIDPGDSGGENVNVEGNGEQRGVKAAQARMQGRELQLEAAKKKFNFQQKMRFLYKY